MLAYIPYMDPMGLDLGQPRIFGSHMNAGILPPHIIRHPTIIIHYP